MRPVTRSIPWFVLPLFTLLVGGSVRADVYNLKVVTDASPDYSDMDSMIHSITNRWSTPREKVWAMFYFNHVARRQTAPMYLHGMALTDPIRQFNDYGYTMCSTIAGINCSIWDAMGLKTKYWDISAHTVSEVFYDGRWHMVDNSMSALYTLCDGQTIAGVEDIGKAGSCEASGGKVEPGHIAKYHCLNATSPRGFLTSADCARDLEQEYRCFNPNGLKYRYYFYDWDRGHRYILNLRGGESYTRHFRSLGDTAEFYVPNNGKDPEAANPRYHIRGNGLWTFRPELTPGGFDKAVYDHRNVSPGASGLEPAGPGVVGAAVFKVQSANVTTSQVIRAVVSRRTDKDRASISVSTNNGLAWTEVWQARATGELPAEVRLIDEVNGAYEVLIRVELWAEQAPQDCLLRSLAVETTTMLNSKTQPRLNLGENTIYVGAGDPTGSIVLWPELQGGKYKADIVDEENIVSTPEHPGYQGTVHPKLPGEDAYLVYRLDAPRDLTRVTFGGRFYNRAPKSRCELLYSLDAGRTWTRCWSLADIKPPWDVIHYETVDLPQGHRAVWLKYLMNTSEASPGGCSIYAVRMEANHLPADATFQPWEVTFDWSEPQADRTLVRRSHTQLVEKLPLKYTVHVGGDDHPVMNWMRINARGAVPEVKYGYSDGKDVGGEKFVGRWVTCGKNLAVGKAYTCSAPSETNWEAGDPDGTKLTDGVAGPPYAGGTSYRSGALWTAGTNPVITVDLGAPTTCAAFGMNFHGYPWWDALAGEVQDRVEVLTSTDGKIYTSQGFLQTDLRWKDLPLNHMWPDEERITGHTFQLVPSAPLQARYVRYMVSNKRLFDCTELEVLDRIRFEPFDMRVALPDQREPGSGEKPKVLSPGGRPVAADLAAKNIARLLGEPVLDAPTLHCLGGYWIVGGDDNRNARVDVTYRRAGTTPWQSASPMLRVERGAHKTAQGGGTLNVPDDAWLFAGSLLLLEPDTQYELRLSLSDPDGGHAERILTARTIAEPVAPANMRTRHVIPGSGGGSGTPDDPYRGLAAAQAVARPGDLFLLHSGVYSGTFTAEKSGQAGRPIIWRGAGDGAAVLDGQGAAAARPGRVISAGDIHDVWFEKLTLRNADYALVGHRSARLVVRRCHIHHVDYGITCTNNDNDKVAGFVISDNVIEGPCKWPRSRGIEDPRGIQVTGAGHVVCYNRIRGFADAIDTFPSVRCEAIDFHNNDIDVMTDDGIEMDYSQHNTRCFFNRLTNVFQGISLQPVHGGPVYVFRNVICHVVAEPLKMHNSPSGAMVFHNTSVKQGMPLLLMTSDPVRNSTCRNNLFVGSAAGYAYESTAPMVNCDFDYNGFGGGPWKLFLKWNGTRYATLEEVRAKAPGFAHTVCVDPAAAFVGAVLTNVDEGKPMDDPPDLRLKPGTAAVDAGAVLPGLNAGYAGSAPDLGAYELGAATPHYGPRPE
ncbi:MAG: right-handed parallel beta-helix repeat-containing protein [Pirellulales bacterium]|nr:right-handed parallel beta-helix repeat-containing protein [Pirellulales bacterium]